jgi:general secretion pathway protein J
MRHRHSAGFTLIEILISVTLLAVLMVMAMAALQTSVRAVRSGEALVSRTDSMRIAQEFLRRQISQAMPLPFERMEDLGVNFVFEADGQSLRFVSPMPGHLARGGPHVQTLTLARDRDGMRLEFQHSLLNGYDPEQIDSAEQRPPVVVLDDFDNARFEFRGLDENGELTEWSESWEDPQLMPLVVRLLVDFPEDSPQRWATLEIPVLAGTAGAFGGYSGGLPFGRLTPGGPGGPGGRGGRDPDGRP